MENHSILNALRESSVSFKILIVSLICLVVGTVGTNYMGSFVFPVMMVLSFGVFSGSAGAVISGIIAKRRGKQKKPFLYFMLVNVLLIPALVILAFADGGLLGALILQGAVPILGGLDAALLTVWFFVKYRHRMRVSVKILLISLICVPASWFLAFIPGLGVLMVFALGTFAGSACTVVFGIIARRMGKAEKPLLSFLIGDALLLLILVMQAIFVLLPAGEQLGHQILLPGIPLLVGYDALVSAGYLLVQRRQNENSGK